MSLTIIVMFIATAFTVSALLTYRFCSPDSVVYMLDHPNERSLHDRPVPRGGGLAILIALLVCGAAAVLFRPAPEMAWLASGMLTVAGVSFLDDRYSVSPLHRFVAHAIAATFIVYGGFLVQRFEIAGADWRWPYIAGAMFSVMFIVWMINLYNFMDGMDGFAGGMAVIGFSVFAVLGGQSGNVLFMLLSLVIAASTAGFLIFNFPPARIFMGDVGSSTLGLLAGTFSLWGARDGIFPFWVALLVFSPFIADATVTLLRRLLQRKKPWQAHKTHYYQQLVQAGWGHRKTVLLECIIMLGCGMTALWAVRAPGKPQIMMLAGWVLFYCMFFCWASWLASQDAKPRIE